MRRLSPEVIALVRMHLLEPAAAWSEMPIIVLLDRARRRPASERNCMRAWPGARQIYYQRPVATLDLISGVQSALLARLRQRDVRDHIEREIELRRELNHRVKNILASVSSIFAMTRRGTTSLEDFAAFTWGVADEEVWAVWQETGGPPVIEPSRVGYGTRYLRSALTSVFGRPPTLHFDAVGLRCEARGVASRFTRNLDEETALPPR
jgi:two-component sensor histidine kinase